MRCALKIAYNGTHFFGSQIQTETSQTIMGQLTQVFVQLGIHSKPIASGRTDKGVHATGQVCHIDLPSFWNNLEKLQYTLNTMLSKSIRVSRIYEVNGNFHARFGAKKRVYRYIIKEGNSNPFEDDFITFIHTIDLAQIQEKIAVFQGTHDFKHFMKTGSEVHSTQRTIYKTMAYTYKGYIVLYFEANGFLRAQIRLMVGALLSLSTQEIQEQLSLTTKYKLKPAPSNGLYLAKVKY